jgi:hypothetical protein
LVALNFLLKVLHLCCSKAQLNAIAASLKLTKPLDESQKEEDLDGKFLEELLV